MSYEKRSETGLAEKQRYVSRAASRKPERRKELVSLRPDVILGQTTQVTSALVRETRTIPIVFVTVGDPVASGFVANLARPGGNITGFMLETPDGGCFS